MSEGLFDHAMQERLKSEAPLAARMRPRTLDQYIGQEHIVGEGKLLRRAVTMRRVSMNFRSMTQLLQRESVLLGN